MQSIKQQIEIHLIALQQANHALYELTVDLSLLAAIGDMTVKVSQALELLLSQAAELGTEEFMVFLLESEAIEALDEVVDTDAVSALEDRFFTAIDSMEDNPMGGFLAELIEKIEIRYTNLVTAIHELNALLNVDG